MKLLKKDCLIIGDSIAASLDPSLDPKLLDPKADITVHRGFSDNMPSFVGRNGSIIPNLFAKDANHSTKLGKYFF